MNVICIKTFSRRIEAEYAQGLLVARKITAYISADDAGGMYPIPFLGRGVRLLVSMDQAKEARRILNNNTRSNHV